MREAGHVQADFGDDRAGQVQADAGDLRQPLRGGQHGRPRAGIAARGAVGVDAPGGGDRLQAGGDLALQDLDVLVEVGDQVQQGLGHVGVALGEHHARQGLRQVALLAPQAAFGQGGQGPGVALRRRAIARMMSRADLTLASAGAPMSACTRRPPAASPAAATPGCGRAPAGAGCGCRSRSARISAGGTNDGRSRPISASRASHCASSRSVFGRPASCRAWEEFTSCHGQPGGLQHVDTRSANSRKSTPSRPAWTPSASSRPASAGDLRDRRGHLLDPATRRPPSRCRRQPGAHHRRGLRDVDPRDPLVPQLVLLVLHQSARSAAPSPAVCPPCLLSLEPG